jgi:ssDNA-binding Zn-finger/Zn-ribbon topoisomerase 1
MTANTTRRAYDALSSAYEAFNQVLFENTLPSCLITMQRRHGAYGFFAAERFASPGSPALAIDEIALNPSHFCGRPPVAICATLAQEMVHAWQHHFGKPGRLGYCNREWAAQMRKIGLIPTDTGQPGGKETGQRMSCYVEQGGAFEHACRAFLADNEVVFYHDRENEGKAAPQTSRKTCYTCPTCKVRAWAKPGVSLRCEDCDRRLLATVSKRALVAALAGPQDLVV